MSTNSGELHVPNFAISDHAERAIFGLEPAPEERTLVDILTATINAHPDIAAIEAENGIITYGELLDVLNAQVERLQEHGVGTGSRVGIRVPSGTTDLYVAILATIYAGAAYVPVDWDELDTRADTVWEEANVDAVFGKDLSITHPRHIPEFEESNKAPLSLDNEAWIIFTSGSTGKPKGVAISHRSAAALVDSERLTYLADNPLRPNDRVMAGLSVAFDASCEEMWLAWAGGATLVAASRDTVRSGDVLGRWIVDQRITAVSTVPTLAAMWDVNSLNAVRLLIFGGEACPPALAARLQKPGREVWNTYGPTEATVIGSAELMDGSAPIRIGRPIPGWLLAVVDENEQPVKWGETGQLIIAGVGLGRYLDPEKDAEKYAPLESLGLDRAYRTGDLVVADKKGLIFEGRADDQVKIGGRRLELGEVDEYLNSAPGVHAAAAAVQKTQGGNSILVGYVSGDDTIDLADVRAIMKKNLPDGIVPQLTILDTMPMKTSGKVDRKALPWPLEGADEEALEGLTDAQQEMAQLWIEQIGSVPLTPDSNFFEIGGSSVAIAQLAARIREDYPSAEIAELYANPKLNDMARYLSTLDSASETRSESAKIPKMAGVFQFVFVCLLYLINTIRYVLGALIAVWGLGTFFDAGWVPSIPGWPLLIGWIIFYSLPGKAVIAASGARVLTAGMKPGIYKRGSWTHLRMWAAGRLLTFMQIDNLYGSPMAPTIHRMFGNKVAKTANVSSEPSVTGLATIGEHAVVEQDVDVQGYWIDGDTVLIGTVTIDDRARVGMRTFINPNSHIERTAEVLAGSTVSGTIPAGETWGGSPITKRGVAGESWPSCTPQEIGAGTLTGLEKPLNGLIERLLYNGGLLVVRFLQIVSMIPGFVLVYPQVASIEVYEEVFPRLLLWIPAFTILMAATWLAGVAVVIRLLSVMIRPGFYSSHSAVAAAVWLTHVIMQRTLISAYPIYASGFTPAWLRLLGARIGKNVEISTVETIPHLTWIRDNSFLADHSSASTTRHSSHWVHIGTTVIGERSFVGNSGIVGPDQDVPDDSLIAVLSTNPGQVDAGSSWLGQNPHQIPRRVVDSDSTATYKPTRKLRILRGIVECCRIIPQMFSNLLDLLTIWVLTIIYMQFWFSDLSQAEALAWTSLLAWPVLLVSGTIAAIIPIVTKWLLVGRFRVQDRPLFSSFVWRGELIDVFVESLAIPGIIRMSLGSPIFNLWNRLLGVRIGKNVWCETWWLPEFDLVTLENGASVNRGTVVQTHLFQDRVMSMEPVTLEDSATLGPNSFTLPGSSIGQRATIGPGSLVQRHEIVPADTCWQGNPAQYIPVSSAGFPRDSVHDENHGDAQTLNHNAASDSVVADEADNTKQTLASDSKSK